MITSCDLTAEGPHAGSRASLQPEREQPAPTQSLPRRLGGRGRALALGCLLTSDLHPPASSLSPAAPL